MSFNPIPGLSGGTQLNRVLDSLGYPDAFGDAVGALIDLKSGNLAGARRNLIDLRSGLTTGQMDRFFGRAGAPGLGAGFFGRARFNGPHLVRHRQTYAIRQQVGKRARIGQRYGFRFGPFRLQGRISGRQYAGSFAKPVRLASNQYLYRGRTYPNLGAIARDARDGRIDGQATRFRTRTVYSLKPGLAWATPQLNAAAASGGALGATGGGVRFASGILNAIFNQAGGLRGGIPSGIPGMSDGQVGSSNSTGSVLSNPNLTMEDKLALLMAKLSEHLDKQIEGKMKEIESAMKKQQSGRASGSSGQASGTGGAGGASASGQDGQKPNLQLLQTQLQQLLQKRQQMFQTMSAILKSLHDTSMNAIRNLKA